MERNGNSPRQKMCFYMSLCSVDMKLRERYSVEVSSLERDIDRPDQSRNHAMSSLPGTIFIILAAAGAVFINLPSPLHNPSLIEPPY